MRILYYFWGENSKDDTINALVKAGHSIRLLFCEAGNYLYNPALKELFQTELAAHPCDVIFSYNYFPVAAEAAAHADIPYISWVYDCPHWSLYSDTIASDCNYLFLFDKDMLNLVTRNGAKHAFHLPLAADPERILRLQQTGSDCSFPVTEYDDEISFVGNLYENNHYRQISYLSEDLRGYLDGLIAAQEQVYGYYFLPELLTDALLARLKPFIHFEKNLRCFIPDRDFLSSMLAAAITCNERCRILAGLSSLYPVSLYTASNVKNCPGNIPDSLSIKAPVGYETEMPLVFLRSKINLNITLRSITSGIPLRAIDIMASGGFLLSNYQPELADFFTPGKDFVYYDSLADLKDKVSYYLSHDKERESIARHGYETVSRHFSLDQAFDFILDKVSVNASTRK